MQDVASSFDASFRPLFPSTLCWLQTKNTPFCAWSKGKRKPKNKKITSFEAKFSEALAIDDLSMKYVPPSKFLQTLKKVEKWNTVANWKKYEKKQGNDPNDIDEDYLLMEKLFIMIKILIF